MPLCEACSILFSGHKVIKGGLRKVSGDHVPLNPGKMELETNKKSYKPGDTVKVKIKLDLKKPTSAKWLKVIIEGTETAIKTTKETVQVKGTRGNPGKKVEKTESEEVISALQYDEKLVGEDKVYKSGTYEASFKLPKSLRSSAKSGKAKVEYCIRAKLNIPLSLDLSVEEELVVK
jgi:hypothetical protein